MYDVYVSWHAKEAVELLRALSGRTFDQVSAKTKKVAPAASRYISIYIVRGSGLVHNNGMILCSFVVQADEKMKKSTTG